MRSLALSLLFTLALCVGTVSQQPSSSTPPPDSSKAKKNKNEPAAAAKTPEPAAQSQPTTPPPPAAKPEPSKDADKDKEEHYDMTEVPPVVSHHQITVDGKLLKYTATAGRLPIKRGDGRIDAEMFFVAYTLDGQE